MADVTYVLENQNEEYSEVGLGTLDPLTTLEGIYGNKQWSFDLNFTVTDGELDPSTEPAITDISVDLPTYISSNYTANSGIITLFKNEENPFEESYTFFDHVNLASSTIVDLDTANTDGLSITSWNTPEVKDIDQTYSFNITYDVINSTSGTVVSSGNIVTKSLDQTLYWDFEAGLAKMQEQVEKSEF